MARALVAARALCAWPCARRWWLRTRILHGRGRGAGHVGHVGRVCWPHNVYVYVTRFGGGSEPSR
eukprot:2767595-Prymnesium_polylepis.1